MGANCTVTCNIQPGAYRSLDETLKKLNKYNNLYISEIDVLSMATTIDDNHNNKSNNSSGSNNNKASSDTLIDGFVDLNVHDDEVSTLTFPSKKKNDFSDVIKSYNDDVKNNNIDTFTDNTNDGVRSNSMEQSVIINSTNDYSNNNSSASFRNGNNNRRANNGMEVDSDGGK